MKATRKIPLIIICMSVIACSEDNPTEPETMIPVACGKGEGYPIEFCRQVEHYTNGYGIPGQDYILVDCLVGPEGATVSNTKNGTYYCAGRYRLSTYTTATIGLHWGGTTTYTAYEEYQINSRGEGQFTLKVTKKSGGSGNIFLSMSSGSKWMFDVVLVNTDCK